MKTFTNTHEGTDVIIKIYTYKVTPTNTYTAFGMRGLGNISESNESSTSNTHKSIINFAKKLNDLMNKYRVIKDFKMKERTDKSAEIIIQQVFRIFYFRLKVQEPVAQYHWFKHGDKVSKITMKASWGDDDIDDLVVELCIFPLIGQFIDSNLSNLKVFTHAKVFINNGNCVSISL
jgi:hypothetical protein